jgi:hypothetical protein
MQNSKSIAPARDLSPHPWLLLLVASLAAWFPICRPYLRMGDDFHFAGWLLSGGIPLYFRQDGVWRIFGHELGHGAALANPLFPGVLALGTHVLASLLLLAILRKLLASGRLSLLLASIFAVYPWGSTALTWTSASTYALATMFFLAVLCVLLRTFPVSDSVALPLCIVLAAFSLFSNEALFFAILISGGFVLFRKDMPLTRRLLLAAAPAIGCFIWWVLYKIFPGQMPTEHIKLNPPTLLSGIYYQYTNLWVFQPWASAGTRNLLFFAWSRWQFAAGLILICAVLLCLYWMVPTPEAAPREATGDNRMLGFLLLLLMATVAIYAIGGGFSLDCRKKYPIIPVLLMAIGFAIDRYWPQTIKRPRINRATILTVTLCGIATTWLQIALWRYEATRLDLLVNLLSTQKNPGAVHVNWDSRIQAAWPHANQFWGAPVEDWVLSDAINFKNKIGSPPLYSPPIHSVTFDPKTFLWQPASTP